MAASVNSRIANSDAVLTQRFQDALSERPNQDSRNSIDNVWFCAKFGGPATGIALGLTVFFSSWPTTIWGYTWKAMGIGILVVVVLVILNRLLEISVKNAYGPYKEEKNETEAKA